MTPSHRNTWGSRDEALVKQTNLAPLELKYQQKDKINLQIVPPYGHGQAFVLQPTTINRPDTTVKMPAQG